MTEPKRDWSKARQHGDIEVIADPAAGVWVGKHVSLAVLSQGRDEHEAVAATVEAVALTRRYCEARGIEVPRWAT